MIGAEVVKYVPMTLKVSTERNSEINRPFGLSFSFLQKRKLILYWPERKILFLILTDNATS